MPRKDIDFDLSQATEDLEAGKPMNGKEGFLIPLIKQLTEEAALTAEKSSTSLMMSSPTARAGIPQTVKSASGSFELDTPRDRSGSFEPQFVKKNQTHLTDDLDRKIIASTPTGTAIKAPVST